MSPWSHRRNRKSQSKYKEYGSSLVDRSVPHTSPDTDKVTAIVAAVAGSAYLDAKFHITKDLKAIYKAKKIARLQTASGMISPINRGIDC